MKSEFASRVEAFLRDSLEPGETIKVAVNAGDRTGLPVMLWGRVYDLCLTDRRLFLLRGNKWKAFNPPVAVEWVEPLSGVQVEKVKSEIVLKVGAYRKLTLRRASDGTTIPLHISLTWSSEVDRIQTILSEAAEPSTKQQPTLAGTPS